MTACPEVQQCFYVTGATDFILVVLTKSLEDYEGFTRRMLLDDANVRSFTTHVVLDRVNEGLSVPLGNDIALHASNCRCFIKLKYMRGLPGYFIFITV